MSAAGVELVTMEHKLSVCALGRLEPKVTSTTTHHLRLGRLLLHWVNRYEMYTDTTDPTRTLKSMKTQCHHTITVGHPEHQKWYTMTQGQYSISTYLPTKLLGDIF